jgi:hypothetical protein
MPVIHTDADTRQWVNAHDSKLGKDEKKKRAELNKLYKKLPHRSSVDRRKNAPMNKALQVINITKKIRSMGYQPEVYDITAKVDEELSYEENLNNFLKTFELRKPDEDLTKEELEDALRKDADLFIEYICETTGRDREDVVTEMLLAQQEEADLEKRASELQTEEDNALFNMDIYNFNCKEQYSIYKKIEGNSPIRVSGVFQVSIVEKLVKLINIKIEEKIQLDRAKNIDSRDENPFVESGFLHHSMLIHGLYNLNTDLNAVREAKELYSEIKDCFTDPRIFFNVPFTIVRQNILNGGSDDVFWLQSKPELKPEIKSLCDEFKIKDTDVAYFILIYALDSLYKNQTFADGYENSHYYTKGELLSDLRQQINKYAKSMNDHFVNKQPILEEELAIKKILFEHGYNVHPDNIKFKERVIARIKNIGNSMMLDLQEPASIDAEQVMQQSTSVDEEKVVLEPASIDAVVLEPTNVDDFIKNGVLSVEEICNDIKLEEWHKSRCPMCGCGIMIGMHCDFCGRGFDNEEMITGEA